jgi:KUP system potassium uptake protein
LDFCKNYALILNYFGQGAYLIQHEGETLEKFRWFKCKSFLFNHGKLVSTYWNCCNRNFAAVIASQALISGSFTLINEAMRLNFWPKVRIKYPTEEKGQLYIPSINWLLLIGCIGIVIHFERIK